MLTTARLDAAEETRGPRVLAVVALYRQHPRQSKTLLSLANAFVSAPALLPVIRTIIVDNSPTPVPEWASPFPVEYVHSRYNKGCAGAFNRGLLEAESAAIPWLLVLDQDTNLTHAFLEKMLLLSYQLSSVSRVAAVVPYLRCSGQWISPMGMAPFYRMLPLPLGFEGEYTRPVVACDSATMMRVTALREVGGYDEGLFWLDFSDIFVFRKFHQQDRSVYLAGDLQLDHSLAMMDYDRLLSIGRYRNFLAAEGLFLALYGTPLDRISLTCRLPFRAGKQLLFLRNKRFAVLTWMAFLSRLFLLPARCRKMWKHQLQSRTD